MEFDDRGPEACIADMALELKRTNPELLSMATQYATALDPSASFMGGVAMFCRLLHEASPLKHSHFGLLPRVTFATRQGVETMLRKQGAEKFLADTLDLLERENPELLTMTHRFAERQADYVGVMQGFAMLYRTLVAQSAADWARAQLH